MITLTEKERRIAGELARLKKQAGSHSPSLNTICERIEGLQVEIDACFLANPYATDLFAEYLKKDLVRTNRLRDVLESYPSQNAAIAEKLGRHLKLSPDKIFIGNGATEIIQALLHNFTKGKLLLSIPTFSPYFEFAKRGTEVVFNRLSKADDYRLDMDAFVRKAKRERPDTVVLINPNNPDGNYIPIAQVERMLTELRDVQTVIVDESFIHFTYEGGDYSLHSCVDFAEGFENLVVVKSMSKDFGVAGIRVGYAVMSAGRVAELLRHGFLWNVSGLAEYFLDLYVRKEFLARYEKARVRYIKDTHEFFDRLCRIPGIKAYPSMANFVLVELLGGARSEDFVSKLLIRHGIYVRTCADKIGLEGEFVRIASRKRPENRRILRAIQSLFR